MAFSVDQALSEMAANGELSATSGPAIATLVGKPEQGKALIEALINDHGYAWNAKPVKKQGLMADGKTPICLGMCKTRKGQPTANVTLFHSGKIVVVGELPVDVAAYGFVAA